LDKKKWDAKIEERVDSWRHYRVSRVLALSQVARLCVSV